MKKEKKNIFEMTVEELLCLGSNKTDKIWQEGWNDMEDNYTNETPSKYKMQQKNIRTENIVKCLFLCVQDVSSYRYPQIIDTSIYRQVECSVGKM